MNKVEIKKENKPEKQQYVATASAVLMLMSGVVLSFIAYFRSPEGTISEGVLWFTAQCLIYAGSIFGVSVYVQNKVNDIRTNM